MLAWLSRRVIKDAWYVVGTWALLSVVLLTASLAGPGGTSLFGRSAGDTTTVTGSQSAEGQAVLDTLSGDARTVTLLVTGIDISSTSTQERVAEALTDAHSDLRQLVGEQHVLDPFVVPGMLSEPAAQAMASADLDSFLIIVTVDPNGTQVADADDLEYAAEVDAAVSKVEQRLAQVPSELVEVSAEVDGIVSDESLEDAALRDQARADLAASSAVAVPAVLVVLLVVLLGVLLAGAPALTCLVAAATSLGALLVLSLVVPLQAPVVSGLVAVATAASTAFGVLVTTRYRQQLLHPRQEEDDDAAGRRRRARTGRRDVHVARAMRQTLTTAGRTVLVSGLLLVAPLAGAATIDSEVLRAVGLGGVVVTGVSVAAAVTLVPAVLVLLGRRLERPSVAQRLLRLLPAAGRGGQGTSPVAVLLSQVRGMPWMALVACAAVLVALASPVRHAHLVSSTTDLLPVGSDQRTYVTVLEEDYPSPAQPDATLIISATGDKVASFITHQVSGIKGVTGVTQPSVAGDYTVVYLDLDGNGATPAAEEAVKGIRALAAPADLWVTGQAASQVDLRAAVIASAPTALGVTVVLTVVVLLLATGSVLLPLQAMIASCLSLAAGLGVTTWVFQSGHLADRLGVTSAGGIETYVVVMAAAVGYGLTMHLEAVHLARVAEQRASGLDDATALATGLRRSRRAVLGAAGVTTAAFGALMVGELLSLKELGFALAVIMVVDALVVRTLLVPAMITLLGGWAWWSPPGLAGHRSVLRG
ncbi:MMPL family transporter [Actinomyces howellii]|uniref:Transport protein n=1 Tax=Actinomyces howellii TaxID=52771 RepID=A0A3S4SLG6_9ACTO|nr:MMPL family transporter [Actinomyces howellii]VEG25995.1 transport protein [Actinomyces howellii]